ncbi:uncharacterized protein LOC116248552 [Nymphaea colorata]|nr:uncharacterized protein LOC116248552 [Nymphaea colorata]
MDLDGLSLVCNGLGFDRDGAYHLHQFCLENMKDLQRFLRRDNPQTRDVFKQVCRFNTVAVDLVPIIEQHNDDRDLLMTAVKVLVFMTMPVDPMSDDIAQQIEYLWNLKASLTRKDVVVAMASLLEEPLEHLDSDAFTEDDFNLVQLVFTLFRNLLAVQGLSPLQKASGTSTQFLYLAERFLEILFSEHVMELILVVTQYLSGSDGYLCQDNLLLLDIFHYIFLAQKPELVACPSQEELMGNVNAAASLSSLRSMLEEEDEKRRVMRLKHLDSLHFAGTFVRYNVDGSKTLLKGKPSVVHADSLLKSHKVHRGPLKRIMWEHESLTPPNRRMLELLHGFAEQFLSGGYNVLMQSIRNDIQKDHHTVQNGDVMHFFQVARFFTAYQFYRYPVPKVDAGAPETSSMDQGANDGLFRGAVCGPIAETMNEAMFTLVLSKWHYAFDSLKETHDYKFLSSSGSLMKEMIRLLDLVQKLFSKEPAGEAYVAHVLLHKIFYDQTEEGIIHFLFNLLKSFDSHKQPRSDLADLVEMVHIILQLMESFQSHGALRVSKKSRRRSKKRLGSVQEKQVREVGEDVQIDAVAEMNGDAMHSALDPLVDLENAGKGVGTKDGNCDYSHECGNESSENDEQAGVVEVDLDVTRIMSMFANGKIVQNLCWLLRFYKSNHTNTNHYIISLLQRISDDLEMSPMLFQLSILCIFFEILHDQKKASTKEYKIITSFITKLVGKLMNNLKSHPLLFVDILFWKTNRDCHYINSEFLLHEIGSLRSKARKLLHSSTGVQSGEANKTRPPINIADALGDDEADLLPSHELDNIDEHEKSSQSGSEDGNGEVGLLNIRTSLSAEGSGMDKDLSLFHSGKRARVFSKEEETMIRELFEQFKTQKRCSHLIANALDSNKKYSAAQVSRKLKQLGLQRPCLDIVENNRESNEIDADFATTERKESDDETLSAYKERLKTHTNSCLEHEQTTMTNHQRTEVQDDASDDEPLGVIFKNAVVQGDKEGNLPSPSAPNANSDGSSYEHKNMDSHKGHGDYLALKEIENGADSQANRKKVRRLLHKSVETDFTHTDDVANLEDDVEGTPRNVFRKRQKVVFDLEDE